LLLVYNILNDSSDSFKYSLLGLFKAPHKLKHVFYLLNDKGFKIAIAFSQCICDVLIFNHKILKACHFFILSLKITFKELWDLTELLFLSRSLFRDFFTISSDIFRNFLKTIDKCLLVGLITFNDLISFR
jgi:hypothetical protein